MTISHFQGSQAVASRVVFENGFPKKSKYRNYKLKTLEKGEVDDFKSMREILFRRLKRISSGQDLAPDLIIIDGGKGQLSSVLEVAKSLGLNDLQIVALAKRKEEIFTGQSSKPVIFPVNSPAMHLFQRIRDEAHRFALNFHRKLRGKEFVV
jgi:excinuclease ABC subunit C